MAATSHSDEYRKLLQATFGARLTSFTRQFTILQTFTFAFVAFILAPMVSLSLSGDRLAAQISAHDSALVAHGTKLDLIDRNKEQFFERQSLIDGERTSLNFVLAQEQEEFDAAAAALEEVNLRAAKLRAEIDESRIRAKRLQDVSGAMSEVLDSFDAARRTEALRDFLGQLSQSPAVPANCERNERPISCMVRLELQSQWDRDFDRIRRDVLVPIAAQAQDAASDIDVRLRDLRASFDQALDQDPEFWMSVQEKRYLMDNLSTELERAFEEIQKLLKVWIDRFRDDEASLGREIAARTEELERLKQGADNARAHHAAILEDIADAERRAAELEATLAELDAERTETTAMAELLSAKKAELVAQRNSMEEEKAKVAVRLSDIQSPFGKLPIGLREATLAFPFLLAVGVAICASLLADLVRLCGEITGPAPADREQPGLLAPLWLESVIAGKPGPAALALLLAPAAVFVGSIAVVLSGVLDAPGGPPSDFYLKYFYYALYLLGAGLIFSGGRKVYLRWKGGNDGTRDDR